MKRISIWMATSALIGLGMSGAATAQVTYDYVGSTFSVVDGYHTTSDFLSGSVTLASALGDNLSNVVVSFTTLSSGPTGYNFSDGLTGAASGEGGGATFTFSTSSTGAIKSWTFDIAQDATEFTSFGPVCHQYCDQTVGDAGLGQSFKAGSWTRATTAPEMDPVSAASGLTLLAGGLLVLRGRRRLASGSVTASRMTRSRTSQRAGYEVTTMQQLAMSAERRWPTVAQSGACAIAERGCS